MESICQEYIDQTIISAINIIASLPEIPYMIIKLHVAKVTSLMSNCICYVTRLSTGLAALSTMSFFIESKSICVNVNYSVLERRMWFPVWWCWEVTDKISLIYTQVIFERYNNVPPIVLKSRISSFNVLKHQPDLFQNVFIAVDEGLFASHLFVILYRYNDKWIHFACFTFV